MPEAAFDDFYRETRADLLHQSFLLTGDLTAATAGTREAYVLAWQGWARVGTLADPLTWVRPLAWRLSQRRHTGRLWHRHTPMTPEQAGLVEGVTHLGGNKRKVFLLIHAVGVDAGSAAAELSLTEPATEQLLAKAEREFADRTGVAPADASAMLSDIRKVTDPVVLPRTPIVMRAGQRRRHLRTSAIAGTAVALTVSAGFIAREPTVAGPETDTPTAVPTATLTESLLDDTSVSTAFPAYPWREAPPGDLSICQPRRFADSADVAAITRFTTGRNRRLTVVQTAELAGDRREARATYETWVRWFGGCRDARAQLVSTYEARGVGDDSIIMTLQVPGSSRPWHTVSISRTDATTTTIVTRSQRAATVRPQDALTLAASAVRRVCGLEQGGRPGTDCRTRPRLRPSAPPVTSSVLGLLNVVDLPPIRGLEFPWVATDPDSAAKLNPAATLCDETSFARSAAPRTRTYLMPQANLPVRFGLAQTHGVFAGRGQARTFVDRLVKRMSTCPDRDVTTKVDEVAGGRRTRSSDRLSWVMRTEVSESATVLFRVGVVREGRVVSQVTFIPAERATLTDAQMTALLVRAGQRLTEVD